MRPGDEAPGGVGIPADALSLAGGDAIRDLAGEDVVVAHAAVPPSCHRVDGVAPRVSELLVTSRPAAGDTYWVDEVIEVTVRFSEAVTLTGSAELGITIGDAAVGAACAWSGGATLACRYRVSTGDSDPDGISVAANQLSVADGTIEDGAGTAAELGHGPVPDQRGHKVAAVAPRVRGELAEVELVAGGDVATVSVAGLFAGAQLALAAASADDTVVRAALVEDAVRVTSGREGRAWVVVTARNPLGATEARFRVIVTTAPAEAAVWTGVLAGVGRATLRHVQRSIGGRVRRGAGGAALRLAGIAPPTGQLGSEHGLLDVGRPTPAGIDASVRAAASAPSLSPVVLPGVVSRRAQGLDEGLAHAAFALQFGDPWEPDEAGGRWVAWGGGDVQHLQGAPGAGGAYGGELRTRHLGVDVRGGPFVAGVMVSRSAAATGYGFRDGVDGGGELRTTLLNVSPFVSWRAGATEVWTIATRGWGRARAVRAHLEDLEEQSELGLRMGIVGGRHGLGGLGPVAVAVRGGRGAGAAGDGRRRRCGERVEGADTAEPVRAGGDGAGAARRRAGGSRSRGRRAA